MRDMDEWMYVCLPVIYIIRQKIRSVESAPGLFLSEPCVSPLAKLTWIHLKSMWVSHCAPVFPTEMEI